MSKAIVMPEINEIIDAGNYSPAISIIIPFDPKMVAKSEISLHLKSVANKVEKELLNNYSSGIVFLMMQKLNVVFNNLNFSTHKKSLAIYLSPVLEKVLYLDITVEEKVIVDESFAIRDLVYSKKQLRRYLLLMISAKECKMFLGDFRSFVRIVSNTPSPDIGYENEKSKLVGNFFGSQPRSEVLLEKFLRQVDNSLDIMLQAYQVPLFVMGSKKILGHFNKLTRHKNSVIEFIYGNYENACSQELKEILEPYIADWGKVKETALIRQLSEAAGKHKLVTGISDVWAEATHHKGVLLVVEKNYVHNGYKGSKEDVIYQSIAPRAKYSYVKDAVDDIIEKVLESGGDVEFVEEGVLNYYGHIALIKFF